MKNKIISVLILSSLLFVGCEQKEMAVYDGKEYVALEYPANVFYYDYNGNSHDNFEEVDGIYPVESIKWEMIWNGGDLYCAEEYIKEANQYYASDDNYDWYIQIDEEDDELNAYPIELTEEEKKAVYNVEKMEKECSVFFEEFEAFGSIIKISKDSMVRGIISIAKYDGKWYWKSETIDESREEDGTWPEYIQLLPETLNEKIKENE